MGTFPDGMRVRILAVKTSKLLKSAKRGHTWAWILVFVIIFMVLSIVMSMLVTLFVTSTISSKITKELDSVSDMAATYLRSEKAGVSGTEILGGIGRDFIITDKDGNVTEVCGTNTCNLSGGSAKGLNTSSGVSMLISTGAVFDFDDSMAMYADTENNALVAKGNGDLHIDISELITSMKDAINESNEQFIADDISGADVDEDDYETEGSVVDFSLWSSKIKTIELPFWISLPLTDERHFIGKAYMTASVNDAFMLMAATLAISIIMFIIFALLLANIISGILRRRKTLKVFYTDAVTGGHNWSHFVVQGGDLVRKLTNHSSRYAVINLVFLNYRNFCVCHSVEEGEKVLCDIYKIIAASVDGKKELCAHCSGPDYALLLRFTDGESLRARVNELIGRLSKVDPEHVFAFHAGIEIVVPDGTLGADGTIVRRRDFDIETAFNNACTARETLDGSDDSGIEFFNDKLVEDKKWIDAVQERQQAAIDNEEFVVYYQPKYDPITDELRGAEALIRWQSPDLGFVPPGRMIPIFEKNGFITEIDHYMISHVARDQKRWHDSGFRCVPVSVNVSRAHFIESDLAEQIRDIVDAAGTPHDLIEIELTESAFFDDKKAMINTITKLKQYGFAVSMDDFGSGYSSLNSLKDMPLDVLKLDAEFFRGESGDGRGEIVVSEAIRLAKNLNMRTVAEGVEVREQVDFLASQGCDMIQGFFYAKPMPGADYEARMTEGKKPKDE